MVNFITDSVGSKIDTKHDGALFSDFVFSGDMFRRNEGQLGFLVDRSGIMITLFLPGVLCFSIAFFQTDILSCFLVHFAAKAGISNLKHGGDPPQSWIFSKAK